MFLSLFVTRTLLLVLCFDPRLPNALPVFFNLVQTFFSTGGKRRLASERKGELSKSRCSKNET